MQRIFFTVGVNSLDRSIHFYRQILGFEPEKEIAPAPGVRIAFLTRDGSTLELVERADQQNIHHADNNISLTFLVRDFAPFMPLLVRHDIGVLGPVEIAPGITMLRFRDPDGLLVSLVAGLGADGEPVK